jgi:predicted DNA-binding transcriptional regulator AlpA
VSGPARGPRRVWTVEEIRALGVTCDLRTAAHVLGIGRTTAFELLRAKKFPVRTLKLGRARRVPVSELLDYVGALPNRPPDDPPPAPAASLRADTHPPEAA